MKMLPECALRAFDTDYFCVHQCTFNYEVTIVNLWSYHSPVRVSYEIKREGAVPGGVCDVPHTVKMSARQAIEAMMSESQHI